MGREKKSANSFFNSKTENFEVLRKRYSQCRFSDSATGRSLVQRNPPECVCVRLSLNVIKRNNNPLRLQRVCRQRQTHQETRIHWHTQKIPGITCREFFSYWRYNPLWVCILQPSSGAIASSRTRFLDHTQRRVTVGMTPLDEWSVRRRDLYLTIHNTHNRQTFMPPVGFEPTIAAGERP